MRIDEGWLGNATECLGEMLCSWIISSWVRIDGTFPDECGTLRRLARKPGWPCIWLLLSFTVMVLSMTAFARLVMSTYPWPHPSQAQNHHHLITFRMGWNVDAAGTLRERSSLQFPVCNHPCSRRAS
ncbi:hypothetical protein BDW71DRAFT_191059 [Aspergillus fruticulosus]